VNKELTILRAMLNHAFKAYTPPKILHVPRFPEKMKEPNPRQGFVTDEQYDALQANCKHQWLRALLAIAYTFGFRKGELVGRVQRNQPEMKVSQINLKNRTIHLWAGTTKNEQGRTVKMTDEVYNLLCECVRDKKPDDAVFTWATGKPVKDFRGAWSEMTKAAGLPSLLPHDFRRSAARNLLCAGVSRDVAKRVTDHLTDSMFSRYNIVAETDLADAADKLEARRIGHKLVIEKQSSDSLSAKH
jgi:integrase